MRKTNSKTLKVSFVNLCLVEQESLAINRNGQSRRPLGFEGYIKTERTIVHGNRELICFAAREEKVKKVIDSLVYVLYGLSEEEIKIITS